MLKAKELKDQSESELKLAYRDLSKEIFNLTNELKMARKLEKPHLLREKKKDRARILTVLKAKEQK
ncbi:MAG: 50S ribosomal protein L29 [Verrucomicrobia bacterium]|nr:50S ribosomal protein L29 [Verrucomicrobiota bacterium]